MTETRKQKIIKLIGPYMDKTLSEGCLLQFDNYILKITQQQEISIYDGVIQEQLNNGYTEEITQQRGDYKILGHYDITAVDKFITEKIPCSVSIRIGNKYRNYYSKRFSDIEYFMRAPNKPLHLYTEQEEEELLELLLKLK